MKTYFTIQNGKTYIIMTEDDFIFKYIIFSAIDVYGYRQLFKTDNKGRRYIADWSGNSKRKSHTYKKIYLDQLSVWV